MSTSAQGSLAMQMRLVRTRKDPTFVHVILVILEMALTAQVYALHAFNINFLREL